MKLWRPLILSLGAALLASWVGAAWALVDEVPLSKLEPDRQQRQTTLILTKVVERFHYKKEKLDDALSAHILDRYLESLDPNRSFFTQKDVDAFSIYRNTLDDALERARLEPAFDIFKHFRRRVESRVTKALAQLQADKFDFTRDERYRFDREKADWAADDKALDDLWRKRIKNDILVLRLSGDSEDEIHETLRKRYEGIARRVRQFDAEDVYQTFVNAYTLSIEPHTGYMSPRSAENFDIGMRLSLQGIGAVLRTDNEHTVVERVVPGGPADRSGELHSGDRIVGVAQGKAGEMEDVVGWRLQNVVDLIRGAKDTLVRLNILPKSAGSDGRTRELSLVRDEIKLEDQAAKKSIIKGLNGMDGLRIGVIELPGFYRDFQAQAAGDPDFRSTTRDVRKLLKELEAEGVDGIVIDLRRNGGGSLTEAVELTGLFIKDGPVVQVRDSSGKVEVERDTDEDEVYSGPLAVLVDRNSASASEIFAGAIQDYRRGIIIGEPTFGKGTVQTLVNLGNYLPGDENLGRLRLTMAQFFRVNGGSTQHRGVMPDVVFPSAKGAAEHGERALENALPWAAIQPVVHHLDHAVSVAQLRELDRQRIAKDIGFSYLLEEENEMARLEAEDSVSLKESERRKEWDRREQARLKSLNRFLVSKGLPPRKQLDADDDEDPKVAEKETEEIGKIMLDESAHILADYINLQRPLTAQQR